MSELSPAAQAVLDSVVFSKPGLYSSLAAALRAAADQVVPEGDYKSGEVMLIAMNIRLKLLAIADELQG